MKQTGHVKKGNYRFSMPKIIECRWKSSFLLDDNRVWNTRKLSKVPEEPVQKFDLVAHCNGNDWPVADLTTPHELPLAAVEVPPVAHSRSGNPSEVSSMRMPRQAAERTDQTSVRLYPE